MEPNRSYVPVPLQERAAWYQNYSTQFNLMHLQLGFTAADALSVTNDNATVQFVAEAAVAVAAFAEAMRMYRIVVTEGEIGDRTPSIPTYTGPTEPTTEVDPGIWERLDTMVKRIRVSPGYTDEAGALLGIIPSNPNRPPVDEMQPNLKAVSLPGSVLQVKFVRGHSIGVVIETKLDNSDTWTNAGQFHSSPAVLVIPQNPENLPRSVQLRARYVEGNAPVGQFSPIVTAVTQPAV